MEEPCSDIDVIARGNAPRRSPGTMCGFATQYQEIAAPSARNDGGGWKLFHSALSPQHWHMLSQEVFA